MHSSGLPIAILCLLLFSACGETEQPKKPTPAPIADTAKFYPVSSFIREQIQYVDLRNFNLRQSLTIDSSTVETGIGKNEFIGLAQAFVTVADAWNRHKSAYQEAVFQDLGTASYTINYTATDAALPIQRIDILLSEETNILKRLFIREEYKAGDTTITRQFSWVTDQRFQISTSRVAGTFKKMETITVNWDKPSDK